MNPPAGADRRRPMEWLEEKAPAVHRFMTREDQPYPILREVGVAVLVVVVVLAALWGGTGQDFPDEAPVVVIESGSMMHCKVPMSIQCEPERYGRIGTIDPGDLVFVRDIDGRSDILTYAAGGKERYGDAGDVIIYRKDGSTTQTPIIHRAMAWVQVHDNFTYSVPELDIHYAADLNDPALGPESRYGLPRNYANQLESEINRRIDCYERDLEGSGCFGLQPLDEVPSPSDFSGFITRGDNNPSADQPGISRLPIQPDWVIGKARGEVPWLGLVKLGFTDITGKYFTGQPTYHYERAPGDLKVMLFVSLGVIIGTPLAAEFVLNRRRAAREADEALHGSGSSEILDDATAEDVPPPAGEPLGDSEPSEPVEGEDSGASDQERQ